MDLGALMTGTDVTGGMVEPRQGSSPAMTEKVAREFEGLFVSLLLKQMRQSFGGESLIPADSGDVIGGMFDQYLGQHIGGSGGLGLAKVLSQTRT
jgi:flagellar protein FlgJ